MKYIGFATTEYNDVTKFFEIFADNTGNIREKIMRLSARAFIYNYKVQ